jgi:hypothetical protein
VFTRLLQIPSGGYMQAENAAIEQKQHFLAIPATVSPN